ncbi:protein DETOXIFICATION 31 [Cryptomeria japonica]|uniref:protein DETOXIFICATION 31 n=1 Tax=Cryptomeria japonica TaxID=3369 RepID=UPI0027DAA678|nr:protein DETOXIFICATION 31 [Cryptomeria japonica]
MDEESLKISLIHNNGDFDEFSGDLPAIEGWRGLLKASLEESKKLWYLAGPAIFTSLCRYSLGVITQAFAGHIGNLELAAVSIENSVIAGFSMGIMIGMASALETLCGQAFGAKQLGMLGVYTQRSWVILMTTALLLSSIYVWATPILKLVGQDDEIAELAGKFAVWMIPQLFAYASVFPLARFLQAQSKVLVMAMVAGGALIVHAVFSWLVIFKWGCGLWGAALMLNISWWIVVFSQLAYVLSGSCKEAWGGFSWAAFHNLGAFIRLSLASGVMLCLELWYLYILILLAGYLKNPSISVDAISICMNLMGWETMVALGFNIAISVRVSNELGAGHPRAARFAVINVLGTMFAIGAILMAVILITRNDFAVAFTNSDEVMKAVSNLATLLAITMLLNSIQPVLGGVAVGAGWQALVAYINIACYYMFGVPLGCLLGYYFDFGVKGIWAGMICGTTFQTIILCIITFRTKWKKEASQAIERIKVWGGHN